MRTALHPSFSGELRPALLGAVLAIGASRAAVAQPGTGSVGATPGTAGAAGSHADPVRTARPQASVSGRVQASDRTPLVGASVFLAESLEGAVTDSAGTFAFATTASGGGTLVVDAAGYRQVRRPWTPESGSLTFVLARGSGAAGLAPIVVQAGRFTAGAERGATLTPREVVTTPGTAADVNRAIQTLPGVQPVDEGTGLFVRGGDFTETRVLLNDAALLNPPQLLTPTGTFVGTVDPFQLDGIFFSSGGFGARYGNALSAVAALRSLGRAERAGGSVGAGLVGPSAAGALPLGRRASVRVSGNYFDVAPIYRLNGAPRRFDPAPHGHAAGASLAYAYRPTAEVKLYALDTRTRLGVGIDDPAFSGTYAADVASRFAVASWRDLFGRVAPAVSVARATLARAEDFGAFRMRLAQVSTQAFASAAVEASPRLTVRGGAELEHGTSGLDGSVPQSGDDRAPDARRRVLGAAVAGTRTGAFGEADWRALAPVRLVAGVRTDRSTLSGARTVDPRLSAAWQVARGVTLTGAWGDYHQVPDALLYDREIGDASLPPMRARQAVAGLQVGDGGRTLRVEAYDKRYRALAQLSRDNVVRAGGVGRARGVDIFQKGTFPLGVEQRVTYSLVHAERTDPASGVLARAPFDVTHALTVVAQRPVRGGLLLGATWRAATGRPFTPVQGGVRDSAGTGWTPTYGAPFGERFPAFRRLDLSASHSRPVGGGRIAVVYLSLNNALDRRNVQAWTYSADYAERRPVRSLFNRSVYFGGTLIFP